MNRSGLVSRSIVMAALVATAEGCASAPRNVVQMDVGRASRPDIVDKVPRILDQQGYEVQERRDTGNVIRYVTSWVTRAPFEDEAARGAEECRTRLTFEARSAAGGNFGVTLKAESTMQRQAFDGTWVNLPPTPMFREHMSAITDALALEIDMGVRTR